MAKNRVIGLDIGSTHVRAVEVDFSAARRAEESRPTLLRYGQVEVPPGAVRDGEVVDPTAVAAALTRLWQEVGFEGRDVVIGVGNQRVAVRELDLPWMPLPELRASLSFQVEDLLPMSVEDALLDYYPTEEVTGPAGRMVRGQLVAAARGTVDANVQAVEAAGLRPVMVDLNAFALLRALTRGDLADKTVAVVDIGARVTNIVITAAGKPRFVRTLPTGGQDVTDALAAALKVSTMEAEEVKRRVGLDSGSEDVPAAAVEAIASRTKNLVEAVRNTFVYYASNHPGAGIEVAVLSGGGAALPGLGQYLSSATRLPVEVRDPFVELSVPEVADARPAGDQSLMALSVGLAFGVAS